VAVPSQVADSFARAFEAIASRPAVVPVEVPVPVELPAAPAPEPIQAAPAPPTASGSKRTLPAPDELIAQAAADSHFYLLEHENAHATLRANGKRGWYYPTRYGGIRAVVLHRMAGADSAREGADLLAGIDRPEAAHAVVDRNALIGLLPDDATALHGVRSNSAALDLAVVYDPSRWGADPVTEEALLVRAAAWTGIRVVRYRIPVRRITVDDWRNGLSGIAATDEVSSSGRDFPWDRFLQLTAWVARRVAATQAPVTGPSETVRSGTPPT